MASRFLVTQLCLCLLCFTLGVFIPVIARRFWSTLFLEERASCLAGINGLLEIIDEGGYPFRSKWSKHSPHVPSLRVFHSDFSRWSETFEIIAFAT